VMIATTLDVLGIAARSGDPFRSPTPHQILALSAFSARWRARGRFPPSRSAARPRRMAPQHPDLMNMIRRAQGQTRGAIF
jgi:hypothetical protein